MNNQIPKRPSLNLLAGWAVLLFLRTPLGAQELSMINLSHLEHLGEDILLGSDSVRIIHVYSQYPSYKWVSAKESGPEGIACVDDAGRAAVFYLRHYERTYEIQSLTRAKQLLRFVMAMQTEDGQFYNFIHTDRTINKEGKTSFKSFGWWAARGLWAMASGYRVLKNTEPAMGAELRTRIERCLPHIDSLFQRYGKMSSLQMYKVPRWLLYESAADATSELLLGLLEYYAVAPDARVKRSIEYLAEGLMVMQDGDIRSFPYGLHRSWETMWHMWGNGQTEALARGGVLLRNKRMIQSAEREARGFYSRLLIDGFYKEMDVLKPETKVRFEQIAYGVRPMAVGLIRLYEATGNQDYLVLAGLTASWLMGNNVAGAQMYDPATGRCFDGIRDSVTVNKNSGAESTIEALLTLLEVERYPVAGEHLGFRKKDSTKEKDQEEALFENAAGEHVRIILNPKEGSLLVTK